MNKGDIGRLVMTSPMAMTREVGSGGGNNKLKSLMYLTWKQRTGTVILRGLITSVRTECSVLY